MAFAMIAADVLVTALGFGVVTGRPIDLRYWILQQAPPPPPPQPVQAPDEFSFATGETADDKKLPDDVFGSPQDDIGMARQWMRTIDAGAVRKLNLTDAKEAKVFWLLTKPNERLYDAYHAHVYAGTPEKVIISAFLVHIDGLASFTPLKRVQDPGIPGVYLFEVPVSQPGDRLLIILAMKKASYDGILGVTKFAIRSKST